MPNLASWNQLILDAIDAGFIFCCAKRLKEEKRDRKNKKVLMMAANRIIDDLLHLIY